MSSSLQDSFTGRDAATFELLHIRSLTEISERMLQKHGTIMAFGGKGLGGVPPVSYFLINHGQSLPFKGTFY